MSVIISMTTLPSRADLIVDTLRSLEKQTVQPQAIRIWVPPGARCPSHAYAHKDVDVKFYVMHADPGPIAKLSAVHEYGLAADDLVVTIDDDILYAPTWLETLLAGAAAHPEAAVGFAGWYAKHLIAKRGFHFTKEPCTCDVLEGWAGVGHRVKFFREMETGRNEGNRNIPSPTHILYPPDLFRCVDDVWISGYLAVRGVERRVIRPPMSMENKPGHPGLHHRPDFLSYNVVAAQWWDGFGAWGKS